MKITIPETEYFNDDLQEFVTEPAITVDLEHSLYTISEWESIWKKPFSTDDGQHTNGEMISYIKIMSKGELDDNAISRLTQYELSRIKEYILDKATATVINDSRKNNQQVHGKPTKDVITSEIIYFQMIHFGIPFECQHWHLNRLLTLIRVCGIKEAELNGGKKAGSISTNSILKSNAELNKARRMAMNTSG